MRLYGPNAAHPVAATQMPDCHSKLMCCHGEKCNRYNRSRTTAPYQLGLGNKMAVVISFMRCPQREPFRSLDSSSHPLPDDTIWNNTHFHTKSVHFLTKCICVSCCSLNTCKQLLLPYTVSTGWSHNNIENQLDAKIYLSIHLWRYSPFRALASLKACLHSSSFLALLLHLLIPNNCNASLWTTSSHLVLGLPAGLVL